jgi:hypothetical protein
MTTPRIPSLVSLATALSFILALGGCVSTPSHLASDGPAAADERPQDFRFDNEARDYVHVYLVGPRREWLLGRVAPGARATLRIPEAALDGNPESMFLAVLVGEHVTLRAAGMAPAAITLSQPAAMILLQQWTFSQTLANGQLTSFPLGRTRPEVGRQ